MLHLLYILAFTILAFLAVGNLIRNMLTLSADSRSYSASRSAGLGMPSSFSRARGYSVPHPEFLDDTGNVISEPLLVMRSMTLEDAREQLDALYNSNNSSNSNGQGDEAHGGT